MNNLDLTKLSREQLEEEYKLSQWALTWLIHKAGGKATVSQADIDEFNVTGRIYYSQLTEDNGTITTVIEFKEEAPPGLILLN